MILRWNFMLIDDDKVHEKATNEKPMNCNEQQRNERDKKMEFYRARYTNTQKSIWKMWTDVDAIRMNRILQLKIDNLSKR